MSYRVDWDTGSLDLKTREAAVHLAVSFREEGREATAYENVGGEWTRIDCSSHNKPLNENWHGKATTYE